MSRKCDKSSDQDNHHCSETSDGKENVKPGKNTYLSECTPLANRYKLILLVSSIFLLSVGSMADSIAPWSYEDQENWPGICRLGGQQSPIDISSSEAVVDRYGVRLQGPLLFKGFDRVNVTAINNGHTLKWNLASSTQAPTLSGGPLHQEYSFMQFHLHWLSEHAIDGVKYPLEIHMVHRRSDLTKEEAVVYSDGLAVIGVLCQVHSTNDLTSYSLEEIMPAVPELTQKREDPTAHAVIDMSRLLSPHPQSYYTYEGSLTTPQCQEAVTWIVMDQPIIISDTQFKQIHKVDVGGTENFRNLQPRNRIVYRSISSCSTLLTPSALSILSAAINCVASNFYTVGRKGYCALLNLKKRVFGGVLDLKDCFRVDIGF